MPYDPTMYTPYRGYQTGPGAPISQPSWYYQPTQSQMQTMNNLISVTGNDGARAYPMGPNSTVILFDSQMPVFYLKSTDGGGFPTIQEFEFHPKQVSAPMTADAPQAVTRKEFDALVSKVEGMSAISARKSRPNTRKAADDGE